MIRSAPARTPSQAQANGFLAEVGSHLSSRFLEQLSDTIVFPLWATLMLTATLPITAIDASHHRLSDYLRAWSIRSTTSNSSPAYTGFAVV
jgi:hypothetical protein